jgi:rod shape determining protein RodA
MQKNISQEQGPKLDWSLAGALLGLMIVGMVFIYDVTHAQEGGASFHIKQGAWYLIGLVAAGALCLVNYRWIARWSTLGYVFGLVLLVLTLIPGIGVVRGGARRWIDLGAFLLQPSEFVKLAFIFALAHFLSRAPEELKNVKNFWFALFLAGPPFILVLIEPDLGSSLVFIPITLGMMFAAGIPTRFLTRLLGWSGALIFLLLTATLYAPENWRRYVPIQDYQRNRLMVYFGRDYTADLPETATERERQTKRQQQSDDSYSIRQMLISVGSGGFWGKGWGEGTQNTLGFLPRGAAHNDFIFSVIAEEVGFLGGLVVLGLYSLLIYSGTRIASQARDRLGRLLAVGVTTMFFSHVFVNIGMNVRLMPITGLPLPLLSYGGSSVISSLLAAGALQNVSVHRRD